jgi:hypothetical protein
VWLLLASIAPLGGCGARTPLEALASADAGSDGASDAAVIADDATADSPGPQRFPCGPRMPVCPGDTCSAAGCAPTQLASAAQGITGMAVDDTYVYFVDSMDQTLRRVPKCGGAATFLARTETFPGRVVTQGGRVYWTNQSVAGSIQSVAREGGPVQTLAAWPSGGQPEYLVADSTSLYFTLAYGMPPLGVMSLPLAGGAPTTVSMLTLGELAMGADSLFGVAYDSTATSATIWRLPKSGGPGEPVTQVMPVIHGIATDTSFVYLSNAFNVPDGAITHVSLHGGAVTTLATLHETPDGIAVDDQCVYWGTEGLTDGVGSLGRCTKDGSVQETLATGQDRPMTITTDDTSVYWANFGGEVMRAPK